MSRYWVISLSFSQICITVSAQWGFHPGGWGKPPLDEYNRPLYGDVFGVLPKAGDLGVSLRFTTFDLVYLYVYPSPDR